jgi:hypothetical protein
MNSMVGTVMTNQFFIWFFAREIGADGKGRVPACSPVFHPCTYEVKVVQEKES